MSHPIRRLNSLLGATFLSLILDVSTAEGMNLPGSEDATTGEGQEGGVTKGGRFQSVAQKAKKAKEKAQKLTTNIGKSGDKNKGGLGSTIRHNVGSVVHLGGEATLQLIQQQTEERERAKSQNGSSTAAAATGVASPAPAGTTPGKTQPLVGSETVEEGEKNELGKLPTPLSPEQKRRLPEAKKVLSEKGGVSPTAYRTPAKPQPSKSAARKLNLESSTSLESAIAGTNGTEAGDATPPFSPWPSVDESPARPTGADVKVSDTLMEARIQELEKEKESIEEKNNQKVQNLKLKLGTRKKLIQALNDQIEHVKDELEAVRKAGQEAQQERDQAKKAWEDVQAQSNTPQLLQAERTARAQAEQKLITFKTQLESEMITLKSGYQELNASLQKATQERDRAQKALADIKEQLKNGGDDSSQLTGKLLEKEGELQAAKRACTDLEEERKRVQEALSAREEELTNTQVALGETQHQLAETVTQLKEKDQQLDEVTTQLEEERAKLQLNTGQLAETQTRLAEIEVQLDALQQERDEAKEALEKANKTLLEMQNRHADDAAGTVPLEKASAGQKDEDVEEVQMPAIPGGGKQARVDEKLMGATADAYLYEQRLNTANKQLEAISWQYKLLYRGAQALTGGATWWTSRVVFDRFLGAPLETWLRSWMGRLNDRIEHQALEVPQPVGVWIKAGRDKTFETLTPLMNRMGVTDLSPATIAHGVYMAAREVSALLAGGLGVWLFGQLVPLRDTNIVKVSPDVGTST